MGNISVKKEKKSVFIQFILFLIAFMTRWIFYTILITVIDDKENDKTFTFEWKYSVQLILLLCCVPQQILPMGFIMMVHKRTFSRMLDTQKSINGKVYERSAVSTRSGIVKIVLDEEELDNEESENNFANLKSSDEKQTSSLSRDPTEISVNA